MLSYMAATIWSNWWRLICSDSNLGKYVSFETIFEQYFDYLRSWYALPVVVLDGYGSGPTTSDVSHIRRTKGIIGSKILFVSSTLFREKKKQNFISPLAQHLTRKGIQSFQNAADADFTIIKTVLLSAKSSGCGRRYRSSSFAFEPCD